MRLLTPEQALRLDQETFGNSPRLSEQFAREAASAVYEKIRSLGLQSRRTLVLVGPGHNGMDATLVAEKLRASKAKVTEWRLFRDAADGIDPADYELVVDGLFGIGLNRALEGEAAKIVEAVNVDREARKRSGRPLTVVAIDVPSGLNALTGNPFGAALRADWTVTIQAAKPGFFQNQGSDWTGALSIAPLSYPKDLFHRLSNTHAAFGLKAAARLIPRRKRDANKGSFGTLYVVAGSEKYPGAGILTSRAALRTGVGYLRFVHFDSLPEEWMRIPETLPERWDAIPRELAKDAAYVLGPGVTDRERLLDLMRGLLAQGCDRVILDATALELVPRLAKTLPDSWILTPHPKELSRLLGISTAEVQADRFAAAERAHAKYGAVVLLKGYKTIVHSDGKNRILLRGNSALAKAGSGDVLAGIIGGYRAQGLGAVETAVLGGLVHGYAADLWLKKGDAASLSPSDLIDLLPLAQKEIKNI